MPCLFSPLALQLHPVLTAGTRRSVRGTIVELTFCTHMCPYAKHRILHLRAKVHKVLTTIWDSMGQKKSYGMKSGVIMRNGVHEKDAGITDFEIDIWNLFV